MLVVNSMKWQMTWPTRAEPLTKNLFFLGSRSMDPCYSASGGQCGLYSMMRTLAISYQEMECPIMHS